MGLLELQISPLSAAGLPPLSHASQILLPLSRSLLHPHPLPPLHNSLQLPSELRCNMYDHQFRSTPYTVTILSNIVKYASVLSSTLSFISFSTLPTAVFLPHVWSCSFAFCTLPHSPPCTPAPTVDGPHIIFMFYVRYMDASASPDSSSIIFPLYPLPDHVVM